jgi:hypothetical protein
MSKVLGERNPGGPQGPERIQACYAKFGPYFIRADGFNTQEPACAGELQGAVVDFHAIFIVFSFVTQSDKYKFIRF